MEGGAAAVPGEGPAAALRPHGEGRARVSPTPCTLARQTLGALRAGIAGARPAAAASRPESRVFLDSHFHPSSRRPGPQSGLVQTSSSPSTSQDFLFPRGNAAPRGAGRVTAFLASEETSTICEPTSDDAGPSCAGPGRGRAQGKGPPRAALPFGSSEGGGAALSRGEDCAAVSLALLLPAIPRSPAPRRLHGGEGVGGGSRRIRRGRPTLLPCSPPGVGRAGWPGEGKRVGGGGGERGGALVRCSFGAAPAAATAAASFPIHSNKQDGCRYAAALPAAQILGSNRQDVYGQNGTCAPAQPA